VLHRDIKPDNILMDAQGWVKLSDFGISAVMDKDGWCFAKSGTRGYAAPELYLPGHKHGVMSDWFSLGATMHEFLTNARPYAESDVRNAAAALADSPDAQISQPPVRIESAKNVSVTSACTDFLKRLLRIRASDRIKPAELKDHEWFTRESKRLTAFSWDDLKNGVGKAEVGCCCSACSRAHSRRARAVYSRHHPDERQPRVGHPGVLPRARRVRQAPRAQPR
jgi:serine/threonine protein kinase